ncbi:endonuclease III [soil metagenome]
MDKKERAIRIIQILRKATKGMELPASVNIVNQYGQDPYLVLISCLLSLRTKDTVSFPASQRLFEHAKTPAQMLKVPIKTIEKLIYPTGFYHRKAALLHAVSQDLIDRFKGKVPKTEQELRSINGVGPKTANLVLGVAFDIPAICVDTHVHRVSNRLGLVKTKTVEETEVELKKILPPEYWIEYNHLMVLWGQNICVPISPKCSQCAIVKLCPRVGVTRSR